MGIIQLALSALREDEHYKTLTPPMSAEERADLKSSIATVGILDPLFLEADTETRGLYTILDGYNRFAIAREVGLEYVPCLVVSSVEERDTALRKNALRRQLTEDQRREVIEKGKAHAAAAEERLIAPLAQLYRSGKLTTVIGKANVRWLIQAPPHRQEAFLSELQRELDIPLSSVEQCQMVSTTVELQQKLDSERARAEDFRKRLEAAKVEADRNRIKLERVDHDLETAIEKRYRTEQAEQREQTIALTKIIKQLKEEREALQEQLKGTDYQIESAEAETKAAQYAAHQAEALFKEHMQKVLNPKMFISNLDLSIQVLDCAIAQAARQEHLSEEEDALVRDRVDTVTERLALLKKTLRTHRADIINLDTRRTPGEPSTLLRQTS